MRLVFLNLFYRNYRKVHLERGITSAEVIITLIIIGVLTAVSAPSLVGSQRDNETKEAFINLRNALAEVRINANRLSTTCILEMTKDTTNNEYDITARTISGGTGCLLSNFSVDASVVTIMSGSTAPGSTAIPNSPTKKQIAFDFDGTLNGTETKNAAVSTTDPDLQTLWITRNDYSGNALSGQGRCIVLSNWLGMIRSGIQNSSGTCYNPDNDKY
jgi:Tfp pilus assembly protein FimT